MNRQVWDSFLQQINAQVEGDFIALAAENELVTGKPFRVDEERHVLYSMLDQAMMTQHASLLRHTVNFIAQLPRELQDEFRAFGRRRIKHAVHGSRSHTTQHYTQAYTVQETPQRLAYR